MNVLLVSDANFLSFVSYNSQTHLYFGTPRRGGATADGGGRHKGQSLSGEKQLSVSEAVRTLVGHIFRTGGAWRDGARTAMVVGQA